MLINVLFKTRNWALGCFLVNLSINCLEGVDYQTPELNTWGAVVRMSTETPPGPGHSVSEVNTSPGLFLGSCSDQF